MDQGKKITKERRELKKQLEMRGDDQEKRKEKKRIEKQLSGRSWGGDGQGTTRAEETAGDEWRWSRKHEKGTENWRRRTKADRGDFASCIEPLNLHGSAIVPSGLFLNCVCLSSYLHCFSRASTTYVRTSNTNIEART